MTHDLCRGLLSDYLDDQLDRSPRAQVEEHLASCASCRDELEDYRRIREMARGYEPPRAPSDPWPSILRRIAPGRRPTRGIRTAVVWAASIAALVCAGIISLLDGPSPPPVPARPSVVRPAGDTQRFSSEDPSYALRVRDLERLFEQERSRMDPRTAAVVEESLREIDEALDRATEALAADPANGLLRSLMERSQEQKLHLLEDVARAL